MIKKIFIVSSGRADYGMLKKLIFEIKKEKKFKVFVVVTGSHLSKTYGHTYKEILNDKIKNIKKVNLNISGDSDEDISRTVSVGIKKFSKLLNKEKPYLSVILGDRFEIFAFAVSSHILGVPLAHIHGGEVTSGAIDDAFRHSITKLSDLHFVSNTVYAKRVRQLGENPKNIFNVGGLSLDKITKKKLYKKKDIEKKLNFKFLKKNLLITYHPETIRKDLNKNNISTLLRSLSKLKQTKLLFTIPNIDTGNLNIIRAIKQFSLKHKNTMIFDSLGHEMYLSVICNVDGVIGNSSSGLSEVPYLKKGTINIGNRQDGRIKAKSIIDCNFTSSQINNSLKKLYSKKFIEKLKYTKSPYEKKDTSKKIVKIIKSFDFKNIKLKKFFDNKF
jgi:GDP/UDP-N,N'-diacetylbacillosamine 2-epimerase (hydrolysing)